MNLENYYNGMPCASEDRVKCYKFRLTLDVYEDVYNLEKTMDIPNHKFAIDGLSIVNNKSVINKLLNDNFERLLWSFNEKFYDNQLTHQHEDKGE